MTQPRRSLREVARRVPVTLAVIDVAVAAMTATLVRKELIPDNLEVLGVIAALLILTSFVVTVAFQDALQRWLRPLSLAATAGLLLLLVLHTRFVHTVPGYGPDTAEHDFLVGYRYTPQGEEWIRRLGPKSISEYIADIGADRIPQIWGTSYTVASLTYSFTYLAFVLALALALGGTELGRAGPRRRRRG